MSDDGSQKVVLNSHFLQNFAETSHRPKEASLGFVHGFYCKSCVHLLTCSMTADSNPESLPEVFSVISGCLPAGIEVVGVLLSAPNIQVEDLKARVIDQAKELLESDSFLVCVDNGERDSLPTIQEYQTDIDDLADVEVTKTDRSILESCMTLRVQGTLKFGLDYTNHKDNLSKAILAEIQFLQDQVESQGIAYHVIDSDVIIPWTLDASGDHLNVTCKDVLGRIKKEDEDEFDHKKRMKSVDLSREVLSLRLLQKITKDRHSDSSIGCAPIIHHTHGTFQYLKVELPVDVVGYVEPSTLTSDLPEMLSRAVTRQLYAMYKCMVATLETGVVKSPQPFHFRPDIMRHLVTIIYPKTVSDGDLTSTRERLHDTLLLSRDRPQLRRNNRHRFPGDTVPGGYLLNPHSGIPSSGVRKGRQSLVQGHYAYHHYMQDHFNDDGWGCAYRSLQTLVSWFRLQGYTDKPVPSHREIQQSLVDIGDKELKLVGSKQWIGSTEVGYVLDHLLGITCKIMFVSCGAELSSKGRELAVHFDNQGTPVMIGSGNKAHTILGVDFDEVTGDVRFLILDPHYTGGEDLKIIQNKGWCGWKSADFFDQVSFCNLCLPQRPIEI